MGRLSHLLPVEEQPKPVYQLDFGEQLGGVISQVVAERVVSSLTPAVSELVNALMAVNLVVDDADQRTSASLKELQDRVDKAAKETEKATLAELKAIKEGLGRAVKDLRNVSKTDSEAIRSGLISALSRVKIPDYTDTITSLGDDLKKSIASIKVDERPLEWDFDIQRDYQGFIKSVKAKAKNG